MNELLTATSLKRGIRIWLDRDWPDDFHCSFYEELRQNVPGITAASWEYLLGELWDWRAIRPLPTATIRRKGLKRLPRLRNACRSLQRSVPGGKPSISTLQWPKAEKLFYIAQEIKGVESPVFASKLCHFLLPKCYPIIDQTAIGLHGISYEEYWLQTKSRWTQCSSRRILKEELRRRMSRKPSVGYPWETKIPELCRIGARRP